MCGECWAEGTQEGKREGWWRAAGGGAGEASCLPRPLATHPLPGGRALERRSLTVVAEAVEVPRGQGAFPSLHDPCIQSTSAQASSHMAMEGLAARGHLRL